MELAERNSMTKSRSETASMLYKKMKHNQLLKEARYQEGREIQKQIRDKRVDKNTHRWSHMPHFQEPTIDILPRAESMKVLLQKRSYPHSIILILQ
jgi:hypothetical protein